jgi:PPK2 family polyphosphate:nucleotide phosphotransferase
VATSIRSQHLYVPEVGLTGVDPASTPGIQDKEQARLQVAAFGPAFRDNQTRLYASRGRSILLVLQGMDACGKDGVVRNVVDLFYPTSVRVTAFKAPTDEEKQHDFLWRFHPHMPTPGNIAVFNRSWYEDVGIAKVHGLAEPDVIEARYGVINAFEDEAKDAGIALVKCFLHVSYEEQGSRMVDRLTDPTKRWKFEEADLVERAFWPEYMEVYNTALRRCGTAAPWHVIPADHKWYRDWAIAQIIDETLRGMDLSWPTPDLDIPALLKRVELS